MYLLDSNILIHHLNGEGAITSFVKGEMLKFISVISVTELLAKPSITPEQEFLITKFFRAISNMAATAEHYNLILITRDKGFKKVSEMRTLAL